jgi:hypothetical protein
MFAESLVMECVHSARTKDLDTGKKKISERSRTFDNYGYIGYRSGIERDFLAKLNFKLHNV